MDPTPTPLPTPVPTPFPVVLDGVDLPALFATVDQTLHLVVWAVVAVGFLVVALTAASLVMGVVRR